MNSALFLLLALSPYTITDDPYYPAACQEAASSDEAFSRFKQNPRFNVHAEYATREEGEVFLARILSSTPTLTSLFERFRTSDRLGAPHTFDYGEAGEFSPTTLRYVQFAGALLAEFGSLDGLRIVEIGSGYGGLCKIIADLARFEHYTLVDLPECLALAERVLETQGVDRVSFCTPEGCTGDQEYDLVISEYGFSDYAGGLQKRLTQKLLGRAKRGYLACRFHPKHFRVRPLSREGLLKHLKAAALPVRVREEEPLTGKGHCVISWDAA